MPSFSCISVHKGLYFPFLLNIVRKPPVPSGMLYNRNNFLELYSSKPCRLGMACCMLMGKKNHFTPKPSDLIAFNMVTQNRLPSIYLSIFIDFVSPYLFILGVDAYCCTWFHSVIHSLSLSVELLWTRDRPVAGTLLVNTKLPAMHHNKALFRTFAQL
jgi:hypothetical protein